MDSYLQRDYSRSIESLERLLQDPSCKGLRAAAVHTNIAAAQYGLELYRNAIKSCQLAIEQDPYFLRAYTLQGTSYLAIGKIDSAKQIFHDGLTAAKDDCSAFSSDVTVAVELQSLLRKLDDESEPSSRNQSSVTAEIQPEKLSIETNSASLASTTEKAPESTDDSGLLAPSKEDVIVAETVVSHHEGSVGAADQDLKKNKVEQGMLPSADDNHGFFGHQSGMDGDLVVVKDGTKDGETRLAISASDPSNIQPSVSSTSSSKKKSKKKNAAKGTLTREAIESLYKRCIGTTESSLVNPVFVKAVKANLSHASGEELVDDLIACGYLQVNTGNLDQAVVIFSTLLQYRHDLPAAYLGVGSAHAMKGKFDEAIASFTSAISVDGTIADAWKRRGQTRAAKGLITEALQDLTKALELGADPDISNQRGLVYHQIKNYRRALADFRLAEMRGLRSASLYNYIGMCEGQLGNIQPSIDAHDTAGRLDATFKETFLNSAQMHKEAGNGAEAERGFRHVISMKDGKPFHQGYSYFAQLMYGLGRPNEALEHICSAITIMPGGGDVPALTLAAAACQGIGRYAEAISFFDHALKIDPESSCWFQREVGVYIWSRLDTAVNSFSIDNELDSRVKDGWCKRVPWKRFMAGDTSSGTSKYTPLPSPVGVIPVTKPAGHSVDPNQRRLLQITKPLQSFVQLDCQGFLPNATQHCMFGLATLQMAQSLRKHCRSILEAGPGLEVDNAGSSRAEFADAATSSTSSVKSPKKSGSKSGNGSSSSGSTSPSSSSRSGTGKRGAKLQHVFAWRDLFDIAVRWRQVSEPNDPVWWIDRLPAKAFAEGFGLQTPIVNAQLKTIRYYSYFPQAFEITKSLMGTSGYYNAAGTRIALQTFHESLLAKATSLEDLHNLTRQDFYVIQPCSSLYVPGTTMEGTRLTLVAHQPEGYEFTIRTPGTPDRWKQFDKELNHSFQRLVETLVSVSESKSPPSEQVAGSSVPLSLESASANSSCSSSEESVLHHGLELFYFWVTFAPLSRGTAACGYMALVATLLSSDLAIATALPKDKQLDWEAIFSRDVNEFIAKVSPWLPLRCSEVPIEELDVGEVLPTIRSMVETLIANRAE